MGQKICTRNKFGFCKYNRQCPLHNNTTTTQQCPTHNNDICDIEKCKILVCEMRHPKECMS